MRKQLINLFMSVLLLIGGLTTTQAQTAAQYNFSASSGTYTSLSDATVIPFTGSNADDNYVNNILIGFPFKFAGTDYNYVNVSTNGFLVLATASGANNLNDRGTNNGFANVNKYPCLAPLWDDLELNDLTSSSYQLSGVSPNRVLTVEWKNVQWNYHASGPVISFQAKLYEGSNKIEYIYQQGASPVSSTPIGATIGICSAPGVYLTLNNTSTSPSASSTVETVNISTKPATGQIYTFTTSAPAPTTQASAITFSTVQATQMTIGWTKGNGAKRAVFVKEGTGEITNPADNTTYAASANWASKGGQLESSGYYCVYNGTGTSVTVTGLTAGTDYIAQVFEYNGLGGTEKYYTATATDNPKVQKTSLFTGTGIATDPYQIFTASELALVATTTNAGTDYTDKTFVLKNNIDLSAYSNWTAIGTSTNPFKGTFDGKGYTISGLKINATTDYQGLFGYAGIGSRIMNLGIIDCNITSTGNYVGGLVGKVDDGTITNSYSTGNVIGTNSVGGLVGSVDWVTSISNSSSTGSVTGTGGSVGGLVGSAINFVTITNSSSTGSVNGGSSVGGLVGDVMDGTISNTYSTGSVTAAGAKGGLVGYANGTTTITNSFWDKQTSGMETSAGGTGKSTTEMKTQSTYTGWAFVTTPIWKIDASKNNGYPYLAWQTVFNATLTTTAVSTLSSNSATLGGNITDNGGFPVTDRGIVYSSTNTSPIIGATGVTKVTNGTGSGSFSASIGSLNANTTYYVQAYAITSLGVRYGGAQTFATLAPAPTTQASAITFSTVQATQMTIGWTNGNGSSRAVFIKEGTGAITNNPVDNTTYAASANWASKGDQLGSSGYYCVYNGTETSVTVTGLTAGTDYTAQVFEYNGAADAEKYNTAIATDNPKVQTTSLFTGTGTATDPYQIFTASELALVASTNNAEANYSGKTFVLKNNIDLSAYSNWTPIGTSDIYSFKGTFDGNGHTISGLKINATTDYQGLFGCAGNGSTIKNLGIIGCNITSTGSSVGGLVGKVMNGTISNTYSTGSVTGTANFVGGLFGVAGFGTITNSYSTGSVTGANYVGGLVGFVYGGTISNSYSTGSLTSAGAKGGLVGSTEGTTTITNSFWDKQTSGMGTSAGGIGKTTSEMKTQSIYTGWAFVTTPIWKIDAAKNNGYPYLAWQTVFNATLTTTAVSTLSINSATLGGNITDNGGFPVTERGIVYSSTNTIPIIGAADVTKVTNGDGSGSFSASIGSLTANTTYYVHAYAITSLGISYGGAVTFTTLPDITYTITTPTHANIKLTTATLGATIAPADAPVTERGIYWSTSPEFTSSPKKIVADGTNGGTFTVDVSNLDHSSTIYYKGYVITPSGETVYSEASNFPNIPIFTGTGNWEDAERWNVQEVPNGWSDNPVINGICTIATPEHGFLACNDLTINIDARLTLNAGQVFLVAGFITNESGAEGFVIKAELGLPNASFYYLNAAVMDVKASSGNAKKRNNDPMATVEMYSKASWDLSQAAGSKYNWQYFGIPVKTVAYSDAFSNCIVRKQYEASPDDAGLWKTQGPDSILTSGTGYEITQASPTKYSFKGELTNANFSVSLPYSMSAKYPGQHVLGNPYTYAIDIASIKFGVNTTEKSVYLYNTGTLNNNLSNTGNVGKVAGQYTVSTPETAGTDLIPDQIPSMQGFLVKSNPETTGSIFIPALYRGIQPPNYDLQRAPRKAASAEKVFTRIDVSAKLSADRMWIFTDPTCTRNFDNGWDGYKMMGSVLNPQLFAMEADGNYQIDAVNDLNETCLGFQAGQDKAYTLKFTHQNTASAYGKLYLVDLLTGTTTDITADGSEYAFTAETTPAATKRFKIVTATTENQQLADKGQLTVYNSDGVLYIQNFSNQRGEFTLYDMKGLAVKRVQFEGNKLSTVSTQDLTPGAYVGKAETANLVKNEKLIIR